MELREEIGMKKHLKMKVVGSRMRWAGHVQRMGEDRRGWQKKKRKTKAVMEILCQTRSGKGRYERPRVEDHHRRQREMENINNESGRSIQVTWTPRKGTRGRRIVIIIS